MEITEANPEGEAFTIVKVKGKKYSISPHFIKVWNKLMKAKTESSKSDRLYFVDGEEGLGKSLCTLQQAAYIDPTILDDENGKVLPRICYTAKEFICAIENTEIVEGERRVVIWEDAFRNVSRRSELSEVNKIIIQTLIEARNKNLIVFIILPDFFMLDKYAAIFRSDALLHVHKKNNIRGHVKIYGRKKKRQLYQAGSFEGYERENELEYSKTHKEGNDSRFYGVFPGDKDSEERYKKKKEESLKNSIEK